MEGREDVNERAERGEVQTQDRTKLATAWVYLTETREKGQ